MALSLTIHIFMLGLYVGNSIYTNSFYRDYKFILVAVNYKISHDWTSGTQCCNNTCVYFSPPNALRFPPTISLPL